MTKEEIRKSYLEKKITTREYIDAIRKIDNSRKSVFSRRYSTIDRQHESINPLEFI